MLNSYVLRTTCLLVCFEILCNHNTLYNAKPCNQLYSGDYLYIANYTDIQSHINYQNVQKQQWWLLTHSGGSMHIRRLQSAYNSCTCMVTIVVTG